MSQEAPQSSRSSKTSGNETAPNSFNVPILTPTPSLAQIPHHTSPASSSNSLPIRPSQSLTSLAPPLTASSLSYPALSTPSISGATKRRLGFGLGLSALAKMKTQTTTPAPATPAPIATSTPVPVISTPALAVDAAVRNLSCDIADAHEDTRTQANVAIVTPAALASAHSLTASSLPSSTMSDADITPRASTLSYIPTTLSSASSASAVSASTVATPTRDPHTSVTTTHATTADATTGLAVRFPTATISPPSQRPGASSQRTGTHSGVLSSSSAAPSPLRPAHEHARTPTALTSAAAAAAGSSAGGLADAGLVGAAGMGLTVDTPAASTATLFASPHALTTPSAGLHSTSSLHTEHSALALFATLPSLGVNAHLPPVIVEHGAPLSRLDEDTRLSSYAPTSEDALAKPTLAASLRRVDELSAVLEQKRETVMQARATEERVDATVGVREMVLSKWLKRKKKDFKAGKPGGEAGVEAFLTVQDVAVHGYRMLGARERGCGGRAVDMMATTDGGSASGALAITPLSSTITTATTSTSTSLVTPTPVSTRVQVQPYAPNIPRGVSALSDAVTAEELMVESSDKRVLRVALSEEPLGIDCEADVDAQVCYALHVLQHSPNVRAAQLLLSKVSAPLLSALEVEWDTAEEATATCLEYAYEDYGSDNEFELFDHYVRGVGLKSEEELPSSGSMGGSTDSLSSAASSLSSSGFAAMTANNSNSSASSSSSMGSGTPSSKKSRSRKSKPRPKLVLSEREYLEQKVRFDAAWVPQGPQHTHAALRLQRRLRIDGVTARGDDDEEQGTVYGSGSQPRSLFGAVQGISWAARNLALVASGKDLISVVLQENSDKVARANEEMASVVPQWIKEHDQYLSGLGAGLVRAQVGEALEKHPAVVKVLAARAQGKGEVEVEVRKVVEAVVEGGGDASGKNGKKAPLPALVLDESVVLGARILQLDVSLDQVRRPEVDEDDEDDEEEEDVEEEKKERKRPKEEREKNKGKKKTSERSGTAVESVAKPETTGKGEKRVSADVLVKMDSNSNSSSNGNGVVSGKSGKKGANESTNKVTAASLLPTMHATATVVPGKVAEGRGHASEDEDAKHDHGEGGEPKAQAEDLGTAALTEGECMCNGEGDEDKAKLEEQRHEKKSDEAASKQPTEHMKTEGSAGDMADSDTTHTDTNPTTNTDGTVATPSVSSPTVPPGAAIIDDMDHKCHTPVTAFAGYRYRPLYLTPSELPVMPRLLTAIASQKEKVRWVLQRRRRATISKCRKLAITYCRLGREWAAHQARMEIEAQAQAQALAAAQAKQGSQGAKIEEGRKRSTRKGKAVIGGWSADAVASSNGDLSEMPLPHQQDQQADDEESGGLPQRYVASRCPPTNMIIDPKERVFRAFESHNAYVPDMDEANRWYKMSNPWSEEEKAIFTKRYLKYPKNFHKIASFLPGKTTNDCICHYYLSKQSINYKAMLKAANAKRRHAREVKEKEKAEENRDNASVKAAPQPHIVYSTSTHSYGQPMHTNTPLAAAFSQMAAIYKENNVAKGRAEARAERKEQEREKGRAREKAKEEKEKELRREREKEKEKERQEKQERGGQEGNRSSKRRARRESSEKVVEEIREVSRTDTDSRPYWTDQEKALFVDALRRHGRDFSAIAAEIGTKTVDKCKNYYNNNKKKLQVLTAQTDLRRAVLEAEAEGALLLDDNEISELSALGFTVKQTVLLGQLRTDLRKIEAVGKILLASVEPTLVPTTLDAFQVVLYAQVKLMQEQALPRATMEDILASYQLTTRHIMAKIDAIPLLDAASKAQLMAACAPLDSASALILYTHIQQQTATAPPVAQQLQAAAAGAPVHPTPQQQQQQHLQAQMQAQAQAQAQAQVQAQLAQVASHVGGVDVNGAHAQTMSQPHVTHDSGITASGMGIDVGASAGAGAGVVHMHDSVHATSMAQTQAHIVNMTHAQAQAQTQMVVDAATAHADAVMLAQQQQQQLLQQHAQTLQQQQQQLAHARLQQQQQQQQQALLLQQQQLQQQQQQQQLVHVTADGMVAPATTYAELSARAMGVELEAPALMDPSVRAQLEALDLAQLAHVRSALLSQLVVVQQLPAETLQHQSMTAAQIELFYQQLRAQTVEILQHLHLVETVLHGRLASDSAAAAQLFNATAVVNTQVSQQPVSEVTQSTEPAHATVRVAANIAVPTTTMSAEGNRPTSAAPIAATISATGVSTSAMTTAPTVSVEAATAPLAAVPPQTVPDQSTSAQTTSASATTAPVAAAFSGATAMQTTPMSAPSPSASEAIETTTMDTTIAIPVNASTLTPMSTEVTALPTPAPMPVTEVTTATDGSVMDTTATTTSTTASVAARVVIPDVVENPTTAVVSATSALIVGDINMQSNSNVVSTHTHSHGAKNVAEVAQIHPHDAVPTPDATVSGAALTCIADAASVETTDSTIADPVVMSMTDATSSSTRASPASTSTTASVPVAIAEPLPVAQPTVSTAADLASQPTMEAVVSGKRKRDASEPLGVVDVKHEGEKPPTHHTQSKDAFKHEEEDRVRGEEAKRARVAEMDVVGEAQMDVQMGMLHLEEAQRALLPPTATPVPLSTASSVTPGTLTAPTYHGTTTAILTEGSAPITTLMNASASGAAEVSRAMEVDAAPATSAATSIAAVNATPVPAAPIDVAPVSDAAVSLVCAPVVSALAVPVSTGSIAVKAEDASVKQEQQQDEVTAVKQEDTSLRAAVNVDSVIDAPSVPTAQDSGAAANTQSLSTGPDEGAVTAPTSATPPIALEEAHATALAPATTTLVPVEALVAPAEAVEAVAPISTDAENMTTATVSVDERVNTPVMEEMPLTTAPSLATAFPSMTVAAPAAMADADADTDVHAPVALTASMPAAIELFTDSNTPSLHAPAFTDADNVSTATAAGVHDQGASSVSVDAVAPLSSNIPLTDMSDVRVADNADTGAEDTGNCDSGRDINGDDDREVSVAKKLRSPIYTEDARGDSIVQLPGAPVLPHTTLPTPIAPNTTTSTTALTALNTDHPIPSDGGSPAVAVAAIVPVMDAPAPATVQVHTTTDMALPSSAVAAPQSDVAMQSADGDAVGGDALGSSQASTHTGEGKYGTVVPIANVVSAVGEGVPVNDMVGDTMNAPHTDTVAEAANSAESRIETEEAQ